MCSSGSQSSDAFLWIFLFSVIWILFLISALIPEFINVTDKILRTSPCRLDEFSMRHWTLACLTSILIFLETSILIESSEDGDHNGMQDSLEKGRKSCFRASRFVENWGGLSSSIWRR
ncbi:hypothetical protein Y032_0073g788 [Ancylostoma ceylanicum]|uniref:Uncharacterized protein n=1 Tax=Ancylostoma ceylanicum TaxID=53326 RepID=A0A016TV80_9BILA|nr:hypothetical protein Y032_0073g788 [Ancylostoma ceylanicum]